MKLFCRHTELYNDLSESIRAFLPEESVEPAEASLSDLAVTAETDGTAAKAEATYSGTAFAHYTAAAELPIKSAGELVRRRMLKRAAKLSVYRLMCKLTGRELPWGSLTGIRPTKLIYSGDVSYSELNGVYGVEQDKCLLLKDIITQQEGLIEPPERSVDIYVGIPFCRSRCVYCSFATHDATKTALVPQYMSALTREIRAVAGFLRDKGITPRCLYIGGGTPTALNEYYLEVLLRECAALCPTLEYTVEAGRPDTLNDEKLVLLKRMGVERISINPQSMQQSTLELIGRRHAAQDILLCYEKAAKIGFKVINMDVIAGLPGENAGMFSDTLKQIADLTPENITVHTLSVKRGSEINEHPDKYPMPDAAATAGMVDHARKMLSCMGYSPYYLYRQKYQTGNLENVGYCMPGKQCVYNIDIMEETTSIIALGAGAVSKRVYSREGRIERCGNSKSIFDYISRQEEMINRKLLLFQDI